MEKQRTILSALLLMAFVLSLALSACTAAPTRRTQWDNGLQKEMKGLRQESEMLNKRQQENQGRMDQIQQLIGDEQNKQRRFREMMTTNFDLLEQSVAVALAKSINQRNMAEAEETKPRITPVKATIGTGEKSIKKTLALPKRRQVKPAKPIDPAQDTTVKPMLGLNPMNAGEAKPASSKWAGSQVAMPPLPGMSGSSNTVVARPASRKAAASALDDPDLRKPANPRKLRPHPAAKPLYEKGFALFASRDYDQSVIIFENFLNRFPNDLYSDNAQFWVGEALLRLNRADKAEQAYRKVLRNYEHRSTLEGYKTPDAIYRIAQTYQKRSDDRMAKYYYEAVAQTFPDTSAGRKAVRELESIVASNDRF